MNTNLGANLRYRDFWDVPRMFLATHRGQLFLFDCRFDDGVEDYADHYAVYRMSPLSEEALAGSWADLPGRAETYLGSVPLRGVKFDETRRQWIDPTVIDQLSAAALAG